MDRRSPGARSPSTDLRDGCSALEWGALHIRVKAVTLDGTGDLGVVGFREPVQQVADDRPALTQATPQPMKRRVLPDRRGVRVREQSAMMRGNRKRVISWWSVSDGTCGVRLRTTAFRIWLSDGPSLKRSLSV